MKTFSKKYIVLDNTLTESKAWNELSSKGRDLYVFMLGKYNGFNDNNISCTYAEALKNGMSRPVFQRALCKLIEQGFIHIVREGGFGMRSLYGFSESWKVYPNNKYRLPSFVIKTMSKTEIKKHFPTV